jgi:hypothetical protein
MSLSLTPHFWLKRRAPGFEAIAKPSTFVSLGRVVWRPVECREPWWRLRPWEPLALVATLRS